MWLASVIGDRKMEYDELGKLSPFHLDVIRETVNIGAGNAATALSQLLGSVVTMDVPKAELVSIYELTDRYASPTELVCAVYLRFEGEISGNMLWIMSEETAQELVNILIKKDLGDMLQDQIDQIADSLLVEVGNIVLSSFLNAISAMINCALPVTVPAIAHDMFAKALLRRSSLCCDKFCSFNWYTTTLWVLRLSLVSWSVLFIFSALLTTSGLFPLLFFYVSLHCFLRYMPHSLTVV